MNRMLGTALFGVFCGILASSGSGARAEQIVELDLDGVLGDGPDSVEVGAADSVQIDVWIVGGEPIFSFYIGVCNADFCLTYGGVQYHTPATWFDEPPTVEPDGCMFFSSTTFSSADIIQPYKLLSITYAPAGCGYYSEVLIDEADSYVFYFDITQAAPDSTVSAYVKSVASGTENGNWGMIKKLFR